MFFIVFYYLVFLVFFIFKEKGKIVGAKKLKRHCVFAFFLLFIFFGFRDLTVLNDSAHYYAPLREKMSYSNSLLWYQYNPFERFEVGYQIFENILAKCFRNPFVIIIISSFFITIGNILFFKRHNGNALFLCLFLLLNYQLPNQYSAIRQGIATMFFYYGFTKLIEGKWKYYILSILVASTFHKTAIILLPMPLLLKLNLNKKTVALFIAIFFLIINFLLKPLIGLFSADNIYQSTNEARRSFPIASLVLTLLYTWLLYISYRINKNNTQTSEDKAFWLFSMISILVSALDVVFPIIGRINMYLSPIVISLFVNSVTKVGDSKKVNNIILTVSFVFFVWFVLYNTIKPEWYHLYPYSFMNINTIFQGDSYYD